MDTILEEDVRRSIGIIPARLASTRLPGKLLLDLEGKPVLQWTLEGSATSKYLRRLIVATDSKEILEFCTNVGFEVILTPSEFSSGTERVFWVFKELGENYDFILNIQGDEPFINGETIDDLLMKTFQSEADISTLISVIDSQEELFDPSTVKVVKRQDDFALYFSRNPIPYLRGIEPEQWISSHKFYKHIGIYCFRRKAIPRLEKLDKSDLEEAERLEQLRWLDFGEKILCVETKQKLIGIDTVEDLERAKSFLKRS
ncbi:3-deoxy-manno-octulosonate cytidylyltransferase [Bacteroidetes/Chlorobi group bacterium Naka2016]|jgi:3-deoxy-manno-octulosonate cytidylyltransferase (CMP-KDO synthetase)|nr:MAG: 3-deoxy-manno-octulosonate cytidylyltransferase [Bacteroidetes/Chlorobi group bacterium Naka2016]